MKKLSELNNDDYIFSDEIEGVLTVEQLRNEIDECYDDIEGNYYTTTKERGVINIKDIIEDYLSDDIWLCNKMDEIMDEIGDDRFAKIQSILDEIKNSSNLDVYYTEEKIDIDN